MVSSNVYFPNQKQALTLLSAQEFRKKVAPTPGFSQISFNLWGKVKHQYYYQDNTKTNVPPFPLQKPCRYRYGKEANIYR